MLAYAIRGRTPTGSTVICAVWLDQGLQRSMVQNFERKERGATERTITAKIVVTSKVTIYGLGTHTGLGEEWAENDNAGTAAEAQAFKRACSCFGLGRYLYDLEDSGWISTRKSAHWRHRGCRIGHVQSCSDGRRVRRKRQARANKPAESTDRRRGENGRGGLYRDELLGHVKVLCGTVGSACPRACCGL